ncbi:MAG: FGGY-family carbohydrate kinase [Synechococcaceae cyanobacterium]|nr:FGGY-family carbohydrate kinase [Synechococcaceae cyanobacterium]
MSALALGLDLGSSGLRLALLGADGRRNEQALPYPGAFEDPESWRLGLIQLCRNLPAAERGRIAAIAVDGTSGTVLLCRPDGSAPSARLSQALAYHQACPDHASAAREIAGGEGPAATAAGSLARALELLERARAEGLDGPLLLRHQADWLMGWLLGHWRFGEEGNNLRLGWDPGSRRWRGEIGSQPWQDALASIVGSGTRLGPLGPAAASVLGLPAECQVVAGSTDASAAVLAADPQPGDGITVLGTTLVLKQFSPVPIEAPGISCQRVDGRWLVGGASNAGAGVLRRFFDDDQLRELSRQIDPEQDSGLELRPLPRPGERFPVDDPELQPILGPRPVSDALYLQGLLEGLAQIEQQGWQRLRALGAPRLERVISLGGGAVNPQWRRLRERRLGVPVLNRPQLTAALGMAQLALRAIGAGDGACRMGSDPPLPA